MSPSYSEKQRKLFGTALSMKRSNVPKTNTPAGNIASTVSENKIREYASKPLKKEDDLDKANKYWEKVFDMITKKPVKEEVKAKNKLKKSIDIFTKKMDKRIAFIAATKRAKQIGYKNFSYGSEGRAVRDKIAQDLGKQHGVKIKTTWKMEKDETEPKMIKENIDNLCKSIENRTKLGVINNGKR